MSFIPNSSPHKHNTPHNSGNGNGNGNGSHCKTCLCQSLSYQIHHHYYSAPSEREVLRRANRGDSASHARQRERFPRHMPSPQRNVADQRGMGPNRSRRRRWGYASLRRLRPLHLRHGRSLWALLKTLTLSFFLSFFLCTWQVLLGCVKLFLTFYWILNKPRGLLLVTCSALLNFEPSIPI